jgi:hypothetical protein
MMKVENWSDEQVNSLFEKLELSPNHAIKFDLNDKFVQKPLVKEVLLPRLSDCSVPLPSGRLTDANLEKLSG